MLTNPGLDNGLGPLMRRLGRRPRRRSFWPSRAVQVWPCIVCLLLFFQSGPASPAANPVEVRTGAGHEWPEIRFGVLAFRSSTDTLRRWQPVADYFDRVIPDQSVTLLALSYPELQAAVAERRIDLVLTQPLHYVALSFEHSLYSPLATLIDVEGELGLSRFGGVMITRADQDAIQTPADLKGTRIAASSRESLGGYLAQTYELNVMGIRNHQFELLETGTQDAVLAALAAGAVDAGFVRTGLLEQMHREGTIDLADYRVLKTGSAPDYPLLLSTRLYPQWALAAMPWLDDAVAREIARAALVLPPTGEAAIGAGIGGFTIPADYRSLDQLMQTLRLAPYDDRIRFQHIWADYAEAILAGAVLLLLAGLWAVQAHMRKHWRLVATRQSLQLALDHLGEAQRIAHVSSWEMDADTGDLSWSSEARTIFNHDPAEVVPNYRNLMALIHAEDRMGLERALEISIRDRESGTHVYRVALPDGEIKYLQQRWENRYDNDNRHLVSRGTVQDVSEQRRIEERLRQAASVFEHAEEGIMIADVDGNVLDINGAFTRVTGYSRPEVVGKNPRFLNSGRQSPEFYQMMWRAILEQGFWKGELWNRRKSDELFAALLTISAVRDDSGRVAQFVAIFQDITAIRNQQDQLERIAHFDALTQLPNRLLFADRLQQAMFQARRRNLLVAVVYIDLDGFKQVNDIHGHEMGDTVLIKLSTRMKDVLREGDTLSRLGGDEFVAVLGDLPGKEHCEAVLERLLDSASLPLWQGDVELKLSASLGVSFYRPGDDNNPDYFLRQADQAMYQAKQSGKNRYHIFDAAQDKALRGRRESIERIRSGLRDGEFLLYYQPKVNMRTGRIIGMEALLRWDHPEHGVLLPDRFLPLLADDDLVLEIGDWVLGQALDQAETWCGSGLNFPVSVNIAGRHIQAPGFLPNLRAALESHPILDRRLELEILETSALEDVAQVSAVIQCCADLGVSVALDDFGTGYSSLTYLKRLPARTLKIDRGFVQNMLEDADDLAILDGILGMAGAFQRDVIAEGVESLAHAEMLLRMGCDLGQGFFIARPMPAAAVPGWVQSWHVRPLCKNWRRAGRDEMPVLFAMVQHRAWVADLGRYFRGERATPPP